MGTHTDIMDCLQHGPLTGGELWAAFGTGTYAAIRALVCAGKLRAVNARGFGTPHERRAMVDTTFALVPETAARKPKEATA